MTVTCKLRTNSLAGSSSRNKIHPLPNVRTTVMGTTELSFVMAKHFGVSLQQAQRVQALLRLGVTEQDVLTADRLMRSRLNADHSSKTERLLGCSVEDMSRLKALEVLGISSAMLEEEKARILGSLGVKCWGNAGNSSLMPENPRDKAGPCILRKRRCTTAVSDAPSVAAPMSGIAAPTPTEIDATSVTDLEDECLSQHLRIQQLELQVAALVRTSESRANKIG